MDGCYFHASGQHIRVRSFYVHPNWRSLYDLHFIKMNDRRFPLTRYRCSTMAQRFRLL